MADKTFNDSPRPGFGGFPIPDFIKDLLNRLYRKVWSIYARRHEPSIVIPIYKTYAYRGVPIDLIYQLIIQYDDPVLPIEIHTVHRLGQIGDIQKITKVVTHQSLEELGIKVPDDQIRKD